MPAPEIEPASSPSGPLPDEDHAQAEESDTADDGPTTGAATKKRGTKEEAMSKEHLLTHEPFNPHCPFCVRAKTPRKHNRRHHVARPETCFGETITADHVYAHSPELEGLGGDMDALVISDHFPDF